MPLLKVWLSICTKIWSQVENYTNDESININQDNSQNIVVTGDGNTLENVSQKMNLTSYGPEVQKCFQDSFNNLEKENKKTESQMLVIEMKKEIELSITPINYSNQESFSEILSNKNQFDGPTILIGAGHDVYSKILLGKNNLNKETRIEF